MHGINVVGDLRYITVKELFETRNYGLTMFEKTAKIMKECGISFKSGEISISTKINGDKYRKILAIMKEYGINSQSENNRVEVSMSLGEDGKRTVLSDMPIDECNLSNKAMNCLLKMRIKTLGDLSNITEEELKGTERLGRIVFNEIVSIMKEYGISFKEDEKGQLKQNDVDEPIGIRELSTRTKRCLERRGIYTLDDLSNVTINKLFETRNFGIKAFKEIAEIMKKYGISFNNGKIDISFHINGEKYKEVLAIMEEYGLYPQSENNRIEKNMSLGEDDKKTNFLDKTIDKCGLTNRAMNCLINIGIKTLGDLSNITENELKDKEGVGEKVFNEIVSIMQKYGISFKEDKDKELKKAKLMETLLKQQAEKRKQLEKITEEIKRLREPRELN